MSHQINYYKQFLRHVQVLRLMGQFVKRAQRQFNDLIGLTYYKDNDIQYVDVYHPIMYTLETQFEDLMHRQLYRYFIYALQKGDKTTTFEEYLTLKKDVKFALLDRYPFDPSF